ncbi:MAG: hypothetical protein Ta2A_14070 [Treponemataceae bacterium]|nr:MAG: hypothetical protein Ta2A_14070 [Treponemataceae bacterium]
MDAPLFDFSRFPCYNSVMITMQQTVDIPASHRLDLRLDIPPEFPAGQTILTFTLMQTDTDRDASRKKAPIFGCARGQFQMADDFDAPLEDFREYM